MRAAVLTPLLLATACAAQVGVMPALLPRDAADQCQKQCDSIGLRMSAVAIMANHVGCICADRDEPFSGAGTAGGLAAALLTKENDERDRKSRDRDRERNRKNQRR